VRDNRENECLDDIHTAVQRAAELTRSLLRFAQRERSDRQLTSLSQVTDEVIQISRRTFPPAISINGSIAPHLHVLGLQSQLHQVVMNLLFNARDAVDGSGMIWVKVEPITAGEMPFVTKAPFVLLSVSDNGVGMDRATQDKAFEPFFSTKPTSKGTGLGLSTVYGIVRTYGGRILVDSKVGEGSTFRVYLPAVERPTAPASDHRTPTDELVEQGAVALSPDEF